MNEECIILSSFCHTAYVAKKKKKVGRPPGGHTNLEFGAKKPGKRRRRKKVNLLIKRTASTVQNKVEEVNIKEEDDNDAVFHEDSSNSTIGSLDRTDGIGRKRKYVKHTAPPHEMKTRGVKLPRYSFDRKPRPVREPKPYGLPPKYSPIQKRRMKLQEKQEQQQQRHPSKQIKTFRKSAFSVSVRMYDGFWHP